MKGLILIIYFQTGAGPVMETKVGLIFDPAVCEMVGLNLAQGLVASTPDTKATWTCNPEQGA